MWSAFFERKEEKDGGESNSPGFKTTILNAEAGSFHAINHQTVRAGCEMGCVYSVSIVTNNNININMKGENFFGK